MVQEVRDARTLKTKLRNMWAFVVGFFTSHLPYRTQWTSFDELAAYNQGRSCACELMGKDEYE